MLYTQAIQLIQSTTHHPIAPVCIVRKQNGKIDAQLPTGNPDLPFVAINDDLVTESDIMDALSPQEESVSDVAGCLEEYDLLFV